jgi:hypothetical protein
LVISILKMEATCSSEISVDFQKTVQKIELFVGYEAGRTCA